MEKQIKEKIKKIRNSSFKIDELNVYDVGKYKTINLFKDAWECWMEINNGNFSNCDSLYHELDDVMKCKLKEFNPKFDEVTLNYIIQCYRSTCKTYPIDIFIIDGLVFEKVAVCEFDYPYHEFDYPYKFRTDILSSSYRNRYYPVLSKDFYYNKDYYDNSYLSIREEKAKHELTKEYDMYTSKFISDSINSIYKENIIKPIYKEFPNEYRGVKVGEVSGVDVYINMSYDDIGKNLQDKKECDIKLCIQKEDNIAIYYIHQSFNDNEPIWSVVKTDVHVWRFTEEVLKLESKSKNYVDKDNNLKSKQMVKQNIMKDDKFKKVCSSFGIYNPDFEIIDDVILVNTALDTTVILLDMDFNVYEIHHNNYYCTKEELIKYYKSINSLKDNTLSYPFKEFDISQISTLANKISLLETNHGHSSEIMFNKYLINNNMESDDYINLLAYIKFIGNAIDDYYHQYYHMGLIGGIHIDTTYPSVYEYINNIMSTINRYCDDITYEKVKNGSSVASYLGKNDCEINNHILDRIIYLLENNKENGINDLSSKSTELLNLLKISEHKNNLDSFEFDEITLTSLLSSCNEQPKRLVKKPKNNNKK